MAMTTADRKAAARRNLLESGLCEEIAELIKAIDRLEAAWLPILEPQVIRFGQALAGVLRARDAYLAIWLEES